MNYKLYYGIIDSECVVTKFTSKTVAKNGKVVAKGEKKLLVIIPAAILWKPWRERKRRALKERKPDIWHSEISKYGKLDLEDIFYSYCLYK